MASGAAFRLPQPKRPKFSTKYAAAKKLAKNSNTALIEIRGRLPVEILEQICMFLDLSTLHSLRQVNSFYLSLVHQLPAYNLLRKHAAETLRVMHLTKTSHFSLFGVSLPSSADHDVAPAAISAPTSFCSTATDAASVASGTATSTNECGFPDLQLRSERHCLASFSAALDLASKVYDDRIKVKVEKAAVRFPDKWRLMGSTPFPFWDIQKRIVDPGAYCLACASDTVFYYYSGSPYHVNRAYLTCEIPQHFLNCERIAVKHASMFMRQRGIKKSVPFTLGEMFIVNADGQIGDIEQHNTSLPRSLLFWLLSSTTVVSIECPPPPLEQHLSDLPHVRHERILPAQRQSATSGQAHRPSPPADEDGAER
ncbi:hypothetical protein VTN77DRAFT_8678 [Rasamsonia byssochlamydoides]|uniref:uncharacterized protein n=1 Tax=Rasamsonia byssochlamydoides TaxID=89139 RepID=UPI0037431079